MSALVPLIMSDICVVFDHVLMLWIGIWNPQSQQFSSIGWPGFVKVGQIHGAMLGNNGAIL